MSERFFKKITNIQEAQLRLSNSVFNFNPYLEDTSYFVKRVLIKTYGADKFNNCRNKQKDLDKLLKKIAELNDTMEKKKLEDEIIYLKSDLLINSKQIKEQLRFTYKGFDISKTPIPIKLIAGSKNIIENDVLNLLAKGYFVSQVYAFFKVTETEFNFLSNKEKKDRSSQEELKYNNILDLLDELDKFRQLLKKFPDEDEGTKEKVSSLAKIKKMSKQGKNLHKLLNSLFSSSVNDSKFPFCK